MRNALFQSALQALLVALVGVALLACIAPRGGYRMHDLQQSPRARRVYRRLSLSSTHCIILLLSSGGMRSARSLSIFDWNLSAGVGAVPAARQFLARCKSRTTLSRTTCPARHSTICTRNISKLTSEKFGKYRPLFLYIGRLKTKEVDFDTCKCS